MTLSLKTKTNRANAQKSTGPISANGKAAIKKNAIKHGIHSQIPILDHEDPQLFEELTKEIYIELAPATIMEREMADRIIMTLIRQRRLRTAEAATIQLSIDQIEAPSPKQFRVDDALEILEKELQLLNYQINPYQPELIKAKAPHVYPNLFTPESNEGLPQKEIDDRAQNASLLFDLLVTKVDIYSHQKAIATKQQQDEANLRARQLVPNSPAMHFLTRYQVQLDNELTRLLNLYHALQTKHHYREEREVILAG